MNGALRRFSKGREKFRFIHLFFRGNANTIKNTDFVQQFLFYRFVLLYSAKTSAHIAWIKTFESLIGLMCLRWDCHVALG